MEAKQLRLGNIVNFLYGSSWLQGRVTNIGESRCVIGTQSVKPLNIQGIAITEEWLLKLGFSEREDTVPEGYPTYWPLEGNSRFRIYYSDSNQKFNLDVFNYNTGDLVEGIITIDHIHQIQNLFFTLTGHELEVGDI